MKTKFTLFLLLACASVNAQNIVSVQMKDGTVHNYSLDEFSKISFTDGEPTDFEEMYGQKDDAGVLVLTFEDKDYKGSEDTETYWTSHIDDKQYGGSILYGDGDSWFWDEGNTGIMYDGLAGSYGFASGGYAVSNYWGEDFNGKGFDSQLEIATTKNPGPGADGSDNFLVMYCYRDEKSTPGFCNAAPLYVIEGTEEVEFEPQYVYATNTSYALNSLHNGDAFAAPATENSWFRLYAEGVKADGSKEYTYVELCTGTDIKQEWVKFDLTPLGKIKELNFFMMGSEDLGGSYGLNTPGYAAVDNLAIKK